MTHSFSTVAMPGALELLVIAVIVGAIILIIGPKKARTALGVVMAFAVALGVLWFVLVPVGVHVSQTPAGTIRSSIGPVSVAIEEPTSPPGGLLMPTPPSLDIPSPLSPDMPAPSLDIPSPPTGETYQFNPGPLSALGGTRMTVAILPLIILLAVIAGLVALLKSRRPGRIVLGVLVGVPVLLFLGLCVFRMRPGQEAVQRFQGISEELRAEGTSVHERASREAATIRERASREATAIREDARARATAMREQANREVDRVKHQVAVSGSSSNGPAAVTEWTPSEQHAFEADLYPSKQSAAVALARHSLDQSLADLMPNEALHAIHLSVSEDLNGAILDRLTTQITQQVNLAKALGSPTIPSLAAPKVTVDSVHAAAAATADSPSPAPDALTMRFVTIKDLPAEGSADGEVGEIQLTLRTQGGERVRTSRFVNAPWTEGFARWTQQGPGTWVLGESDQLWPTEGEARADAFQRAAEGIERQLRDFIGRNGRYTPATVFVERPNWLMGQITSALQSNSLFAKTEFGQGFERPYGKVYRRAVLVSLPPEKLQVLADRYYRHVEQVRDSWGRSIKSSLALLALIFVVYLVLNAATRGYYVWVMRTTAVLAAVVGVFLVYLFAASTN
jgi:hypothetical protein